MKHSYKINFCVNTCKNFSKYSLPIIIPSLKNCGILSNEILIISGGETCREISNYEGITMIHTQQNSLEYTSLIEIVEQNILSDYWFFLHDTCIAGPNFKKLACDIPDELVDKIALKREPSMSIGLYNMNYLMKHKDRLLNIKNMDNSYESLQKWKQWGVFNEDYMLWKLNDSPTFEYHKHLHTSDEWNVQGHLDIYGTGKPRRVEYFPQLDLSKCKSNYQGSQSTMCLDI